MWLSPWVHHRFYCVFPKRMFVAYTVSLSPAACHSPSELMSAVDSCEGLSTITYEQLQVGLNKLEVCNCSH